MFYVEQLKRIRWASRRSNGFVAFVHTRSRTCKTTQAALLTNAEKRAVEALFRQLCISDWTVGERMARLVPRSRKWVRIGHHFRIPANAISRCRQAVASLLPLPDELARHVFAFAYPKQVLLG